MKSRKILTALFTAASVATLLGTAPVAVNAASSNSNSTTTSTKKSPKLIIQNTPKLSKWGYVVNVNSSAQPIYVGKSNYAKLVNNPLFKGTRTVSPKKIKNVRFKVENNIIMKKHILFIIILFSTFFVFSASMPKWVLDVESEYPKETYLARLGSGATIENAQANALGQLASYFNSQIVVDTKATNQMTNKNDVVSKNQTLDQEISVISEINLVAVEYSKSFYNKKEKKYYIVAYMNREQAWNNLEDSLTSAYEKFEIFQDMADSSKNLMMKYKYSKKANLAGEEFLNAIYKGFLINPNKRKEYKSKVSEINLKIDENSQINVPVLMKVKGDSENILSNCIANELKITGFSIDKENGKNSTCLVNISIVLNEKVDNDVYFVYPEISMSIEDFDGSKKYYSFERKWGKSAGFSLNQAHKKALLKISEELTGVISEDIRLNFLEK